MSFVLLSPAFGNKEEIPKQYTCDGENVSPPLEWAGVPPEAKSLALIVYDPDAPDPAAPKMIWTHWILYNIPVSISGVPEDVDAQDLPIGTLEGKNSWRRTGYGGPCPPIGLHRYFFKLCALNALLPDLHQPDRRALEKAIANHILAQVELLGTYQR